MEQSKQIEDNFEYLKNEMQYAITKLHRGCFKSLTKVLEIEKSYKELKVQAEEYAQYKAIEQELGIDLITKNKVEKSFTIYTKEFGQIKIAYWFQKYIVAIIGQSKYDGEDLTRVYLYNQYGKTWALSRKELENENK